MKNNIARMLLLASVFSACVQSNESYYKPSRKRNENKPIPNGCKKYHYEDGFETIAISQKSADKKHDKWKVKL